MDMGGPPMDMGGGNSNPLTGPPPPLNEDNLPVRPDKESCLYYLNTGTCRSGTQCIFNHPPKLEREHELKKSLSKAGMPAPGGMPLPVPGDGAPGGGSPMDMPPASGNLGMAGMLEKLEALQAGESAPDGEQNENTQPQQPQTPMEPPKPVEYNEEGLPMRTGEQKCANFLKTGRCSYGPRCRFDHPAGLGGLMASPGFGNFPGMGGSALTEGSMAMRPGKDQCPFLARTGSCPFGPECRFDHSGKKPDAGAPADAPISKPVEVPGNRKKEKGLGGTRGRRPPPSGNRQAGGNQGGAPRMPWM